MSSGNTIKLNVGGTIFQTTKSTLTKFDGFFKAMLRTDIPLKLDESGCIFIDRSPKHFDLVLNFMRDGHVAIPDSQQLIDEIQQESQYYLLEGLMELCIRKSISQEKTPVNFKVLETEKEFIEAIANIKNKAALIVNCHVDSNGCSFNTRKFSCYHFIERFKCRFNIYFKPFTNLTSDNSQITPDFYRLYTTQGMEIQGNLENVSEGIREYFIKKMRPYPRARYIPRLEIYPQNEENNQENVENIENIH